MTEIKLPPLPRGHYAPAIAGRYFYEDEMQAYARAAIEADRQARFTHADLDLAAEIWAAAQKAPGEGIGDAEDADAFRWLTDDHADRETRRRCREILERLPVMSYSAARAAIDAARKEQS